MTIGILGAGGIGQAFAAHAVRVGCEVILSNHRGPESLAEIARKLGASARAGTAREAAKASVVFLSVRWTQVSAALADLPAWNGRIVIDATNPIIDPGFRPADLGGSSSSEIVAAQAEGARVVKVANTLPRALLAADPLAAGGRRVLFMSGDDVSAKAEVAALVGKIGFAAIDLGPLASGGRLQQVPGGLLTNLNLIELG